MVIHKFELKDKYPLPYKDRFVAVLYNCNIVTFLDPEVWVPEDISFRVGCFLIAREDVE